VTRYVGKRHALREPANVVKSVECGHPVTRRRRHRLEAHGVAGYSAEQCWQEYRAHALYGLILAIPVSLGVQTTERGDRMFAAMADRAASQVLVNDIYSALQHH
jgi:hypothetical protein